MSNHSHQTTKGKQQLLYGNTTLGGILLVTILFLLNAALILSIDNFVIHNVPRDEVGDPVLESRISGQILDTHSIDSGMLILYEAEGGELKIAKATRNTMHRYRLDLDVAAVTEEPYAYEGVLLDFTVENGQITQVSNIDLLSSKLEAGILIALCFLVTALERMLFEKLRGD